MSGKESSGKGVFGSSSETLRSSSSGAQELRTDLIPETIIPSSTRIVSLSSAMKDISGAMVLCSLMCLRGVRELGPPVRTEVVDPSQPSCHRELPVELRVLPEERGLAVEVDLEDLGASLGDPSEDARREDLEEPVLAAGTPPSRRSGRPPP